mmetsp:Transcript_1177/g.7631  ORF Transcript_1177/g.7631 Transcript_1177/m.7631 type:complete len:173 (+) Transcript_1177:3671-4189(+)
MASSTPNPRTNAATRLSFRGLIGAPFHTAKAARSPTREGEVTFSSSSCGTICSGEGDGTDSAVEAAVRFQSPPTSLGRRDGASIRANAAISVRDEAKDTRGTLREAKECARDGSARISLHVVARLPSSVGRGMVSIITDTSVRFMEFHIQGEGSNEITRQTCIAAGGREKNG